MNAVRNMFGNRNSGGGATKKKKPSSTNSRTTKVSNPVGSARAASGWGKPMAGKNKSSIGTTSTGKTTPTSRNGMVIPNSPTRKTSPRRPSTGKHGDGRRSRSSSPVKHGAVTRQPIHGSKLSKALPSSPQRTAKSPSSPSPRASPKRAGKSGPSKGYIAKGPTYSPDLKAEDLYRNVPKSKWSLTQHRFAGAFRYDTIGKKEQVKGKSIKKAIETFKQHPEKYVAIMFQDDLKEWPAAQQTYTLIHRHGTVKFEPQGISKSGWMTILVQQYQHLPPFKDNILPKQYQDKYTDAMVHHGRTIHSKKNPPIMPGRGMGVGDTPLLKLIGDIDPSDIHQGSVGDCWLLSAISALAEFDGAIKKLFRKSKNLDRLPLESPNTYTVTLWDLQTWKEVDIVMDERLAAKPDGSGLLASKPSEDGELWVCYLEKAFAIHCGGWDKLTGGQCSHAWSIMVGCREQYTIRKNPRTGKYGCFAKYNPHEGRWSKHYNSPHDNMSDMWQVPWPKIGGGGGARDLELAEDQVFEKMLAYDKQDYIVAAGTNGTSDKNMTDGMVDNHAYSVIEAHSFGKIKLFKVRNPWGKGEIENGEFDDDGPGWGRHPNIKAALKPVAVDDGIFYLTQKEFFRLFDHIYVSARSMSKFLED